MLGLVAGEGCDSVPLFVHDEVAGVRDNLRVQTRASLDRRTESTRRQEDVILAGNDEVVAMCNV